MNRIGIFIDGGFLTHLSGHLSHLGKRVSFPGLRDAVERRLQGHVVEQHYVRGRINTREPLDPFLESAHITRHDIPVRNGREVGADIRLALLTYQLACQSPLDTVVLVSADGDMAPLVEDLTGMGVRVLVPQINVHDSHAAPGDPNYRLATSHLLTERAEPVPWSDLIRQAEQDPTGLPVAVRRTGRHVDATATNGRRRGVISYVHQDGYAFLDASDGSQWYVPALPAAGEKRDVDLAEGVAVTFSGAHNPLPGTRYPRAYSLGLDSPHPAGQ